MSNRLKKKKKLIVKTFISTSRISRHRKSDKYASYNRILYYHQNSRKIVVYHRNNIK